MDGENNGKPYFLMDDLGGKPHYFRSATHFSYMTWDLPWVFGAGRYLQGSESNREWINFNLVWGDVVQKITTAGTAKDKHDKHLDHWTNGRWPLRDGSTIMNPEFWLFLFGSWWVGNFGENLRLIKYYDSLRNSNDVSLSRAWQIILPCNAIFFQPETVQIQQIIQVSRILWSCEFDASSFQRGALWVHSKSESWNHLEFHFGF